MSLSEVGFVKSCMIFHLIINSHIKMENDLATKFATTLEKNIYYYIYIYHLEKVKCEDWFFDMWKSGKQKSIK